MSPIAIPVRIRRTKAFGIAPRMDDPEPRGYHHSIPFRPSVETHSMRQLLPPGQGGTWDRRWLVLTVACGLLAWFAMGEVDRLVAQEPAGKADAPAAKDAAPPKEEPPAPAAGDAAANPPANAMPNNAAGAGSSPAAPENLLSLAIRASG